MKPAKIITLICILAGAYFFLGGVYPASLIHGEVTRVVISKRMLRKSEAITKDFTSPDDIMELTSPLKHVWMVILPVDSYETSPKYEMKLHYSSGQVQTLHFTPVESTGGYLVPKSLIKNVERDFNQTRLPTAQTAFSLMVSLSVRVGSQAG